EHKFGRSINVLNAIILLKEKLTSYEIKVFAANEKVFEFVNNSELNQMKNFEVFGELERDYVLSLMGEAIIYIGNSISDGMPNTLLEAIIMEAFPIQSNPGGATTELIEHGKNGYLINNPEDIDEIATHILTAITDSEFRENAVKYNSTFIKPTLERQFIQQQVIEKYKIIEDNLVK